ncbi:hypothetical protein MMC07_004604 [Pseudocyphellaria aurata]|nr:hypothetical protein [Pseudocyphellaria aurata]
MTIYLVTGANRGLGKGLAAHYLSLPNNTVIAAVRDPNHTTSQSLSKLPTGPSSKLIVVKIDSSKEADPAAAVKDLESKHNITYIDVIIANAGICKTDSIGPVKSVTTEGLRDHLEVNAIGPLVLFQAFLHLLEKSRHPGTFIIIGSPLGSIGGMESRPMPLFTYGASKAIANYLVRKIHFEHENLIAYSLDPGWVQTEMGNEGAAFFGMKEAYTSTEDSVKGMVHCIDTATREKTSGHFPIWEGGEFAW